MKATLVIPTYNRSDRLAAVLRCLAAQQGDHLARVVVCDDGSTDDTRSVALGFSSALPLVYAHQEDRGFRAGAARNLGIARAVGDIVVFVDDDVLVGRDFLAAHVQAHTEARAPRLVIGYRHRSFDFTGEVPAWEDIVRGEPDDRVVPLGPDGERVGSHPTPWVYVYSCNFSVSVGTPDLWFDEGFNGWGMEDIELGYRMSRVMPVAAASRARVLHIEDPAPRDPFRCEERALPPRYDTYIRNAVHFLDKFPDDPAVLAWVRSDVRWFVRDDTRGCWVKNGHANDPDAVIAWCRRERGRDESRRTVSLPYAPTTVTDPTP